MNDENDENDEKDEASREAPLEAAAGAHEDDESAPDEAEALESKPERPRRPSRKARRREERRAAKEGPKGLSAGVVFGLVVALGAGAAGGWFGHDAQAKAHLRAESAARPAGSGAAAGPCGAWEQKICSGMGDASAACMQAKSATDLLTPGTCEVALGAMPATLARAKAERAPCDNLVNKLCKELTEESGTCKMVREKTESFPRTRCSEMLEHFPEVLAELQNMERQQGGMRPTGP